MNISDNVICSNLITTFEPGGRYDKVAVSVVRDFLIRKYPHIKTDQKRGRLFQKAFKDIGHHVRKMKPGSRKRFKPKAFYYYVRMIKTAEQVYEEERQLRLNSDAIDQREEQYDRVDISKSEEINRLRQELESEKMKRTRSEERANLLAARLSEQRDGYCVDETAINDDMNRLKMGIEKENLRSLIAEKTARLLAAKLEREQNIRWKAVQDLTKIKCVSRRHIPELDHNHVFDLDKTIGRGTFGHVRLFQYHQQSVAVKDISKNPAGLSRLKLQACVLREANMMLSFAPHPHIVNMLGITMNATGTTSGMSLVTEHILGRSLWSLIKLAARNHRKRALPWRKIMKETGDGIQALHSMNIIHNDLKEDNIMIRQDDTRPVIIDFGKATFVDKPRCEKYKLTSAEELKKWRKNVPWIAPELLQDAVLPSPSTDAFSYGFICYSVCKKTRCKDDVLKQVWDCLYRCEQRGDVQRAMQMFDEISEV